MRVIVVDDNKVELREVCRLIENSGLQLEIIGRFVNGKEAYDFLMANDVDLVVSDVEMPVMDGIELILHMNQSKKRAEVIFISCYDDFDYIRNALRNDAFDYILKPINKQEFQMILKSVCEKCTAKNNMAHAREEAGKKLERYQKIVEEEFFRLNILGTYDFEKEEMAVYEFPELLNSCRITVAKGRIIEVVSVNEDEEFGERKAWIVNLVKQQIRDMADASLKVYSIIVSVDEVAVVFVEGDSSHDIEGELIRFKQRMAQELGIYLTFGMSHSGTQVGELRELYLQAEDALDCTLGCKKSSVVQYEDVALKGSKDIEPKQILDAVKRIVSSGNKDAIAPFVKKHFEAEVKHQSYAINSAYEVVYSVEMVLLEYGKSLSAEIGNAMWEKLNSFDTIIDPIQWISNILAFAIDAVHSKSEEFLDKKQRICEMVKHIIKKKYREKLTIGSIADELNYSGKYLSEVFLEVEKKSIYEYLTEYRMEVAKRLLEDPESKIYMVVESVGYKRKTHFYDLFKSYVGVTPKEYKEMFQKRQRT